MVNLEEEPCLRTRVALSIRSGALMGSKRRSALDQNVIACATPHNVRNPNPAYFGRRPAPPTCYLRLLHHLQGDVVKDDPVNP